MANGWRAMKRDASIELFRICIMFGICLLHMHTIIMHDFGSILTRSLMACVPAFAFLSGWFGMRFSLLKVVRLFALAVFCSLIMTCFGQFLYGDWSGIGHLCFLALQSVWHSWFLYAYFVMMIFAPLVNCVMEKDERILYPVLGFVFCWSFSQTVFGKYIPTTEGLGAYSGFTLLGIYILARLFRKHQIEVRMPITGWALLLGSMLLFVGWGHGFQEYNSIFSVLMASAAFFIFKRIKLPPTFEKIVLVISPSVFSVYLFHTAGYGFAMMKTAYNALDLGMNASAVVTALIAYITCLVLDVGRRMLFCGGRYLLEQIKIKKARGWDYEK